MTPRVSLLALFSMGVTLVSPPSRAKDACTYLGRRLLETVEHAPIIKLTRTPRSATSDDGDDQGVAGPCDDFPQAVVALQSHDAEPRDQSQHRGLLAGHRFGVEADGPGGSGRFWDITVAVELDGKILGGCLQTTTVAYRNVATYYGKQFPEWRLVYGPADDQRLMVLFSVPGLESEGPFEVVLVPVLYRLDSDRLVPDLQVTREALKQYGLAYQRLAAIPGNRARALHAAASREFQRFAPGRRCSAR